MYIEATDTSNLPVKQYHLTVYPLLCTATEVCRVHDFSRKVWDVEEAFCLGAEGLQGPAGGTPLQPATGGGPGLVSGSYGSANAPADNGEAMVPYL